METKKLLIKVILPIVLVLIVILSLLVIAQNKAKQTQQTQTQTTQNNNKQNSVRHKYKESPSERVEKSIKDTKELYGKVVGIFDPSVGDVRFLTVKADIIDIKKLEGRDLSEGQVKLPMIQKEYKVAVDNNTGFEQGTKDDLRVLDFIQATSVEGIHNVEEFTATYVNIIRSSITKNE